jgi:hypothetical protein
MHLLLVVAIPADPSRRMQRRLTSALRLTSQH